MLLDQQSINRLADLIADQVAIKLANRPVANAPKSPVGALSKVDAAAYLGVSTRTVEKYIASGKLQAVKHGAKVTLRIADLDALLTANQNT